MESEVAELEKIEITLLNNAGLDFENMYRFHIDIFDNQANAVEKTYVIQVGNDINKPALVFLHGYLGCSACYMQVLKKLSEKFLVLALDLRGFGRSSRPEFKATNVKETQEFFISALEATFKKMELQKTSFFLAGHSLGGYIASIYSQKHPKQIRQLFLISPLGFKVKSEQQDLDLQQAFELIGTSEILKYIDTITKNFARPDWSVYQIVRDTYLKKKTLKDLIKGSFKKLKKQFLDDLEDYMVQIIELPPSGEYCYNRLFDFPFYAKERINSFFETTNIPTNLFFGENDILYDDSVFEIQTQNDFVKVDMIQNSGHMIHFQNPEDLASAMMFEIKEEKVFEPQSPIPFI